MSIRVSIVVPVYNSHATLPKCLDSLIAQTWQDLEIICVNDKSKDNSIDIIKEYQQKDSRVILVNHTENMNAGGARNSGIRTATGDYVCFCDNDDWMTPDAIEILVKASKNGEIDFVLPQWCQYWNENKKIEMKNLIVGGTKKDNCNYALLNGCRMLGCLIRRSIFFNNNLFFPEKTFFEDNAIGDCLLHSANDIMVVDKVLYYYQMVEGSSSRSFSLVKLADRVKTTDMFEENMRRLGFVNLENKELVNYYYLHLSFNTIRTLAIVEDPGARALLKTVADKVKSKMPNIYVKDSTMKSVLEHPVCYYNTYRLKKSISQFIPDIIKKHIKACIYKTGL